MSFQVEIGGDVNHCVREAGLSDSWIGSSELETLPRCGGAYLLALRVDAKVEFLLRGERRGALAPDWYFYLGSARGSGGIAARLGRHFRKQKKIHWHIDRLTLEAVEMAAIAVPDGRECDLVEKMLKSGDFETAFPGFGSTDCRRCEGHLLRLTANAERPVPNLDL